MSRPKVVFIGGYGRSGSTLLDRILGSTPGFFSVGELRHVWREGLGEDRRCGCGEPFSRCPVWQDVLARACPQGVDLAEIRHLTRRVDRFFRIPQIAAGTPIGFRRDRDRYLDLLTQVYAAVHDVTGARVIVDSSKDVSHGWLLTRTDLDLSVVHLVRDSRAAAFSWQQQTFNPGNGGSMARYSAARSAAEWNVINALTGLLRHTGVPFVRLRYDDLVSDPAGAVSRVIDTTGEPGRPPLEGHEIVFGPNHLVAGNPNRFRAGPTTILADARWRTEMPPSSRLLVSLLTLPARRFYGFPQA